jgi:hypothetical protein
MQTTTFLGLLAAAFGAASFGLMTGSATSQDGKLALQFREQEIAQDFGVGYAVSTGDVNGNGRTDIVAISGTDIVWFEAPTWEKRVILSGATPRDNVAFALHDIDGDGRLDLAVGATWQPTNTTGGGTLHWVRQGAPGASPAWELHDITSEPTLHRIRWADVDGNGRKELVVAPLHGRGTKGPDWDGPGARLLILRPPANPAKEEWPVEVADDSLHILHNFLVTDMDGDGQEEILTASREGVNLLKRGKDGRWSRTLIGEGSPGEIQMGRVGGRRMLATVEPWHGNSIVVYAEQPGLWARTVIESSISGGHALGWADFNGDGDDELVAGWRDAKPQPGVAVYKVNRDGTLQSKIMVDEGGMATEDLAIADLNGDGRPDIIASGRATRNVKIYWNETPRAK